MIRLVTQFDSPRARVAAATPTCGCCCCCCCCVATIIGTSAYTASSAQAVRRHTLRTAPERAPWRSPWPGVLGGAALPLTIVVALGTWWTVIVPFVVWFLLAGLAYRGARSARPWRQAGWLVFLAGLAFVAEFFLGATLILGSEGLGWLYLLVATTLGIGVAVAANAHFAEQ